MLGFSPNRGSDRLRAAKAPCHDMIQTPATRFHAAARGLPSLVQQSTALHMETPLWAFVSLAFCTNIYTFPSHSFNLKKGATDSKRRWHLSLLLHYPIQHKMSHKYLYISFQKTLWFLKRRENERDGIFP